MLVFFIITKTLPLSQSYGYPVGGLNDLLLEIKDHYNEVLMNKWLQIFREICDEDNYHPITVETIQEYHEITQVGRSDPIHSMCTLCI